MKETRTPYQLGFADGFEQGDGFSSGLTWRDPKKNEEYDRGVNAGQAALRKAVVKP